MAPSTPHPLKTSEGATKVLYREPNGFPEQLWISYCLLQVEQIHDK